jgi:NADPH:quinone reductase-like Zn-dependent oxidoreductase
MKAVVIQKWGNDKVFEILERPNPKPKEDQLLIKVHASSVNPVDYKHRKGNHKYILGSPFPIILGYDISGEVIETGKNVNNFKPGDIVFGDLDNKYGGALAEYALGREKCFAHMPDNIDLKQAAAIPLAGLTALQALSSKCKLKPGQTVIINGASGGVGHLAMQIANILGARVIGVTSKKNLGFIKKYLPAKIVDYTSENPLNLNEKADVFFDVAGNLSFIKCLRVLNDGGKYITTLPRLKVLVHKMFQPFTKGKKALTILRKHSAEDMKLLAEWTQKNKLKPEIDSIFHYFDIGDAHHHAEHDSIAGKVVVSMLD